jgi:hypothetical protein
MVVCNVFLTAFGFDKHGSKLLPLLFFHIWTKITNSLTLLMTRMLQLFFGKYLSMIIFGNSP